MEPEKTASVMSAADIMDILGAEEDTFTVRLKKGVVIRFRMPKETRELAKIKALAAGLAKRDARNSPPEWRPYVPVDADGANMAAHLCTLAIEPEFDQLQGLQMAKQNGPALSYIYAKIMEALGSTVVDAEVAELEATKNDSGETSSDGSI